MARKEVFMGHVLLGAENYYPALLLLMAKKFPVWSPLSAIRSSLPQIDRELIDQLVKLDLIEQSKSYLIPDGTNEIVNFYRISSKGFEYVNNLEAHKTNKILLWLAILATVSGAVQIGLAIWQILT